VTQTHALFCRKRKSATRTWLRSAGSLDEVEFDANERETVEVEGCVTDRNECLQR